MADAPVVHIGENSPEYVAYRLFQDIASVEGQKLFGHQSRATTPDRKWILMTYAQCLLAVKDPYSFPAGARDSVS
jgi:hypothetical protein